MAEVNNVTFEGLEKKFPGEGFERFSKIAEIGGFGTPSLDHKGGVDPAYSGGLDIKGLRLVEGKDRLTDAQFQKIEELATQPASKKKEGKEEK